MTRMQVTKKYRGLLFSVQMLLALILAVPQAVQAVGPEKSDRVRASVFEGVHFQLPGLQLGFEVVTEGTSDYTVERTMRSTFPFDTDLTIIGAWGYTGNKFYVNVSDLGDTGDRLFACAIAVVNGKTWVEWGTMYSSGTQKSFEIWVPMYAPGGVIYLLTGYFTSAMGSLPYNYSITFSFPQ